MEKFDKHKALFFINSLGGGGAETVVLTMAEELYNRDIKSVFVTLYNKPEFEIPFYIENYCLGLKPTLNGFSAAKRMIKINSIIKANKIWQLFLSKYSQYKFSLITAHLPLSHKVCMCSPFANTAIYVMHVSQQIVPFGFRKLHGKIMNPYYKNKKVSCVSQGMTNELVEQYGFKKELTKTIYNPVKKSCKVQSIKRDRPYILMIGRLAPQKRQDIAIDLYIRGEFYKTHDLIILGEGPWREKLEKQAEGYDSIQLPGFVNNVNEWLAGATMLLSTSAQEGFGMVLAEALLLGVPVVSTDCHYGPNEILVGELSKYLLSSHNKLNNQVNIEIIRKVLSETYPDVPVSLIQKFKPDIIIGKYIKYYEL